MSGQERLRKRLAEVGLIELADRAAAGEFRDDPAHLGRKQLMLVRELWKYPFPEAKQIRNEIAEGRYDEREDDQEAAVGG
jgi:hypothetical protein